MRKFKKGCAVVVALALSMSFMTGCGDESKSGSLSSDTATATDAADSTEEAEEQTIEEYIAENAPKVELGQYIGVEYEDTKEEVTDDEVQEEIDSFVDGLATYEEDTESEAAEGDTVNIDFVGSVDGEEFDGGNTNGSGYDLVLGSGSFIDDFEEQIEGHKPGDTFTVSVTFPDDYGNEDLNGKDAEFETTLNYIKIDVPAVYSDELVANNTDYSTMEEYEAYVREELEEEKVEDALASAQNEIIVKIINDSVINDISTSEVQANVDSIISSLQSQADTYGIDYDTYIYYYYGYDDEDSFAEYVYEVCEESQKEKMVMCAIADAEGITISDEEAEEFLTNYAETNSVDVDTVRDSVTDLELKYSALSEKVMNFLVENAVATEATTTEEETTEADATEADSETEDTEAVAE
jgi:trigger factor